ncbi:hypothetical protein Dimus_028480 [Dionaea muscipula]
MSSSLYMAAPAASSGSEGDGRSAGNASDAKKRRRMESNRESARRSRLRKQQHLDDLVKQVAKLQRENEECWRKIGELERMDGAVEAANAVLRAEKERLAARLELLDRMIEIAKLVKGSGISSETKNGAVDGTGLCEVGSSAVKQWQLPRRPSMAVVGSSGRFRF